MENSKATDRFRTFVDFARRRLAEAGLDAAIEGARLLQVLGESGLRAVDEGRIRLPSFAVDVLRRLSGRPCEEPYEFVCASAGPDIPARPAAPQPAVRGSGTPDTPIPAPQPPAGAVRATGSARGRGRGPKAAARARTPTRGRKTGRTPRAAGGADDGGDATA